MNIEKIKKTYGTNNQTCEQVWNQAVEAYELSEYFEEHVEEYYLPEAWEQYDYETR